MTTARKINTVVVDTLFTDKGVFELYTYPLEGIAYTGKSLNLKSSRFVSSEKFRVSKGKVEVRKKRADSLFKYNGRILNSNPVFDYGERKIIGLASLTALLKAYVVIVEATTVLVTATRTLTLPDVLQINDVAVVDITDTEIQSLLGLGYNEQFMRYEMTV